MQLDCKILSIDKETLRENCLIVQLGSKDRPASQADMADFQNGLKGIFDIMDLDFEPAILITHHEVSFEGISRENIKPIINSFLDSSTKTIKIKE